MNRVLATGFLGLCVSISAVTGQARADVVTLTPSKDNTLYESDTGSISNGAGMHFFAGDNATNVSRRGVIAFDLATIPAGSTINSVSLQLHMSQTNSGPLDISLHRLLADWGEGTSDAPGSEGGGAPSTPGDATWLHTFFDTDLWSTPGGDFTAAASAIESVDQPGFYVWDSTPDLVADVQAWHDDAPLNFGWLVHGVEDAASSAKKFDTRENPTESFRPMLMIDYTPVPEPASAVILAVWLVAKGRRSSRRRSTLHD